MLYFCKFLHHLHIDKFLYLYYYLVQSDQIFDLCMTLTLVEFTVIGN